jgi:erythromycin esterase
MDDALDRWITDTALPLTAGRADDPLDDVRPVGELVGGAAVVALGASTRLSHELSVLADRLLRTLVLEHGFRALFLEGDEVASAALDAQLRTGADPAALLAGARTFWRTAETLEALRWVGAHNRRHPDDPVRLVHPDRPEPLPADPTTIDLTAVEAGLAAQVADWHDRTGQRVVYWGGVMHTVPRPAPTSQPRSAGSRLRDRLGGAFASVGLTFHHGDIGEPVPAPGPDHLESVLGGSGPDVYALDLRREAPEEVAAWLDHPTRSRLIGPRYDPDLFLSGGSPRQYFDVVVHAKKITGVEWLG